MKRTVVALGLALVLAAGCRRGSPVERRALALVEAARSPAGIPATLVDEDLVERIRRVQLERRYAMDTHDRAKLLAVLAGEAGPDEKYPIAERAQKQRERAGRGLVAALHGACTTRVDPEGLAARVGFLTAAIDGAPPEAAAAQSSLARDLAGATLVRVGCDQGLVGVLFVERGDDWRAIDLFPIGANPFELDPRSPSMK